MFLTILIGLQDTDFFKKVSDYFPKAQNSIFLLLKKCLFYCVSLFAYCLLIKSLNLPLLYKIIYNFSESKNLFYLAELGFFILAFLTVSLISKIIEIIKEVYDTILKSLDKSPPPKIEKIE